MTWTAETPLAELAAASTAAVRILEQHGLDYCCGGARTLAEAAREKGLDPASLLAQIDQTSAGAADSRDWRTAPLTELIGHIMTRHHEYLKLNLPVLSGRIEKVLEVHRNRDAERLEGLSGSFAGLRAELEEHLHKEEMILFPFLQRCEQAISQGHSVPPAPFGSVANPIRVMEREHDSAAAALRRLRELTRDYQLPEWACDTVRALWHGLQELEQDLHMHIHLENNILFPRAIRLEAGG